LLGHLQSRRHELAATSAVQPPDPATPGRIGLIAEDEGVADSLLMLLTSHGYAVERLPLNPDFVGEWVGQSFSCLVVAQHSSSLPGLALIATLRGRGNDQPAALITSTMGAQDCAHAARLGRIELFEKPVTPSVVLAFAGRNVAGRATPEPEGGPATGAINDG